MKLSIVMPVYNESAHIDEVITRIQSVVLPAAITSRELIIVDDGSSDGTQNILMNYSDDSTMVIHSSRINFGKGTAIRIGLTYVTGDIVLVQDGDLEYDPNDYPALLAPIIRGEAKVVYGSRFMKQTRISGMRFSNWLANMILRITVNVLFGSRITDEATAYKVFARDILRGVELRSKRFEFCPEITAKVLKAGYAIKDVPINYNPRSFEQGKKITWRDGYVAFWTLIKFRFVD